MAGAVERNVVYRDPDDDEHAVVRYDFGAWVSSNDGSLQYVDTVVSFCEVTGEEIASDAAFRRGELGALEARCLQLPALPDWRWFAALLPLSLLAWAWPWRLRVLGPLLCGVALAGLHAGHAMALRLPATLEGREVAVAGTVLELPRREAARVRFRFRVDEGAGQPVALRGRRLQLSWYFDRGARRSPNEATVAPGERWRLRVKLRAPHGLRNPGTRDSERRALAERIAATGYVRDPGLAERLAPARGIDAWRDRMGQRIAASLEIERAAK